VSIPNLREALELAEQLGCTVGPVRRTGEIRVSHPAIRKAVRLNGRRKDAPRSLVTLLRQAGGASRSGGS